MVASQRRSLSETPVALVRDASLFGSIPDGSIQVFNTQEYARITLDESVPPSKNSITDLSNLIWSKSFPLIIKIDDKNYARYRINRKPLFMAWIDLNSPSSADHLKTLTEVSSKFPQFTFGYVDFEEKKERLYKLGGFKQLVNTLIRVDFNSDESYIYEDAPYNTGAISTWISGIQSGSVKPTLLSEPSKHFLFNIHKKKKLRLFFFFFWLYL